MPVEVLDLRDELNLPDELLRRHGGWDRPELAHATATVRRVVADVRSDGDRAVLGYTHRFDGVALDASRLRVAEADIKSALDDAEPRLVDALGAAADAIRSYHEAQRPSDWSMEADGRTVGQTFRPIRRVGAYVPGGLGAYPSSVLMTAVPALTAGVEEVAICSPPDSSTGEVAASILTAAAIVGVSEVYRVGGAQAVAAMAFGTASIPACDKIVGPGNVYVTLAKREVFGVVGIDGLYGPSESLVVADETATPALAAAELLTQAEHAPDAAAILVTTSGELLEQSLIQIERRLAWLPRRDMIRESLASGGLAILVRDTDQAAEVCNCIAPEHLCVQVAEPDEFLAKVRCAGTVLLGDSSAAALSDYCAGPSHVLPTARAARYSSGLGLRDFLLAINVVSYTADGLVSQARLAETLATAEGLEAHAQSVRVRLERGSSA
jgi:histidinol dehydrogenase